MPAYRFDRHDLVTESRRLTRDGLDLAVGLRVFDVIAYLVEHRRRAVGRDELIAAVWGRSDAGEALLAQAVLKARRAFGDDGSVQHYIRTIPRFGYQWVADTEECATIVGMPPPPAVAMRERAEAPPPSDADEDIAAPPSASATQAIRPAPRRRRVAVAIGTLLLVAFAVAAQRFLGRHRQPDAAATTAGLILVLPTQVQGDVAEDGWMRLGVMSLNAQALADVPGHAVVPDETALAAVAHAPASDMAQLLRETGASVVVATEAVRSGDAWLLHATVRDAGGNSQIVSASAADPIAAAGALARDLRELFAPGAPANEHDAPSPQVLALSARMKAATLEGQNGRALALADRADPSVAAAPEVALLRTEALIQLGRADEAAAALRTLIDGAVTTPTPRWLPEAWTALGDCELAAGRPDLAETDFRRSLTLLRAHDDRRVSGLAWRGLGIAQAVRNDLDGAETSYLNARLALAPIGDRLVLARVVDGLGYVAAQRGRLADALLRYEQAAAIAAAIGSNETELGSRLNIAQSHEYLLQHALALENLRALLPRLRRLDYPALHRFGIVAYVTVLVETGALEEARSELARLAAESASDANYDAVVDVRLDQARSLLALGDAPAAIRLAGSIRAGLESRSSADLRLETAAVLLSALAGQDRNAARALADDAAIWLPANALVPARVHALAAQAQWQASQERAARADELYSQALSLARDFGAPIVLRDAAVPFARFQLAQGRIDAAAETARPLGPHADEDFTSALTLARVAAARRDSVLARSYFTRARQLAGQRWSATLEGEASAASDAEEAKIPVSTNG
ncbi:winged helix-turn-helix domain-containing protein [Dokdonella sp.]|uniref:winged helix-turn-helix domain-containing protein n=1 Tax=Dokdonella sp. TaxID=2291710 RepID=UPI001B2F6DC8|nr:winged helix-turn-helix domain-containing protein [Dokdonella sp.]MBO9664305.1 winged helix-turn-helix domain-containing protein [Dokdonella sp.]